MNMSTKTIKYILAALIGSLLSLGVMASPDHHEGRLIKALDLTDAQVTQLKALRKGNKEQRQQGREAMKALMQKKQALLSNYDQATANAIADEEASMHKARVLKKLAHQQVIYAMLDDDQKQRFFELLAKHPKGGHKKDKSRNMKENCDD
jgi:protein CpxP